MMARRELMVQQQQRNYTGMRAGEVFAETAEEALVEESGRKVVASVRNEVEKWYFAAKLLYANVPPTIICSTEIVGI